MLGNWIAWGDAQSKEEAIRKANMLRKDGNVVMIQPMIETEAEGDDQLLDEWDTAPWYTIHVKPKSFRK